MSDQDVSSTSSSAEPQSRRTAMQLLTGALGLLLNLVPVGIGGLFFLDPLFWKKKKNAGNGVSAGPEGFVRLRVTADVIPDDGTPVAVTVIDDLVDAWSMYKGEPIGSVWIRKTPKDGNIIAFNSTCPHLGCSVDYRGSDKDFYCPCHTSSFDLNGEKTNEIPPRGMDTLEIVRATGGVEDRAGRELWLKFVNYKGATYEKVPV